ncbi:type II toxin-antitoxin system VapC family toxin [Vallicoccus soli]|uniref:Ribonuclease VapC n=1 Tax=Vallicoccus soli TaxID=2339232 RepID=A0A3A3Z1E0_9ACTN|nr:type II toxin-antitoxin system VapC family toxin [Vallicoccus soli]RJK96402.1 type II toxin-antitoxin system VapC family toxin [Vallicoccus soli]
MIIDSSAVVAIALEESDADRYLRAAVEARPLRMSAANLLAASIVVDRRRDPVASRQLDRLVELLRVVVEPVTERQARLAREAYRDFGRGSGHPANLNFGDCFAYALARDLDEPLLFKGDDFVHTDVEPAVPQG